jgi:protein involved in polysaccharide export with SLBB domain
VEAIGPIVSRPVDYTAEVANPVNTSAEEVQVEKAPSGLPYFGYSTFSSNPYASDEGLVGNIDPGYIIGPGDELRVYLWGDAEKQFQGTVDVNGNLFFPDAGQVFVAGTTYEDLLERFRNYLSKYYSGLEKDGDQNVFIDVSLTKIRPIRVVMMGEAKTPGSLMINAFATTLNTIYANGGVNTSGSLRQIKVFRKNRLISTIDLYDYLTKGALSEDIRLTNNDVVFVPTRLNAISISGEVNNPGIFELLPGEYLSDLVSFASGLKATAFANNLTIRRIKERDPSAKEGFQREVLTLNYEELLASGERFELKDGDEIIVGRILDKIDNQVTIDGSVYRPGDYQIEQAPKLYDLLTIAGGFKPNTYFDKVDLFRRDKNGDLRFNTFSLADLLARPDSEANIDLQPDDSVKVYSKYDFKTEDLVSIEGFVEKPITMIWRENLTVYDLIYMSANVDELEYQNKVLTSRADLLRYQEGSTEYQLTKFNLDDVLSGQINYELQPRDKVIVYSKEINQFLNTYVTIRGAVQDEGKFELIEGMHIEDLILQAGGFLRTSSKESATVSRENFDFSGNQIAQNIKVPLDIDYLLGKKDEPEGGFTLQHNDYVAIDLIPGSSNQREVAIAGEIKYPGVYFMKSKGETLKDLINRAGGISKNTYIPGGRVFRRGQQIAVDFDKLYNTNNDKYNIILQDQDSVFLPETTFAVRLMGEVANPSYQKFVEGQKLKTYLKSAGGKTKQGKRVYVTQPNGFTYKKTFFKNPVVLDGATITVAAKPPKKQNPNSGKWLETFGVIMGIISSTALTIAVINQN